MRYGVAALAFFAVVAGLLTARPAAAVRPFFDQFKALYEKPNTKDHTMQIFNAAVEKKQCGICHRGKPSAKGPFNPYGAQLKLLLSAKRDAQDPKAIRSAMATVGKMKANPDDPKSLTFAARLRQGKLPVGEIIVRPAEGDAPPDAAPAGK